MYNFLFAFLRLYFPNLYTIDFQGTSVGRPEDILHPKDDLLEVYAVGSYLPS